MIKIIFSTLILLTILPVYSYSGQVGSMAPPFSLVDLTGKTVSLEHLKGKVVFLDFWAPWCAPCKEELPELDKLYRKYGKDGFEVVGISMDTSQAGVSKFLAKVPVTFLVLIDVKGDVSDAYRVSSLPTGFIISKDGTIRYRHLGFGSDFLPIYEKEIEELLKSK
jgi:peroxiredoxin